MSKPFDLYQAGVRPLLFSVLNTDPEALHQQMMTPLDWLDRTESLAGRWTRQQLNQSLTVDVPSLHQALWGLNFANPVGLAAGFDKNGQVARTWGCFGFGFAEVGTVTFHAQPGNPKPRLFRLPDDQAVLNRMGFNNQGAAALAQRLAAHAQERSLRQESGDKTGRSLLPLGINLGKSKITPLEEAAEDYVQSFRLLQPWGDYFVVNVSSPNTPGLRSLQDADQLERILSALQSENQSRKPLLVKIAPDLEWEAIADILTLAQTYELAGIIATNTTIRRDGLATRTLAATGNSVAEEAGGISGAPLRQRSTEVIRFIYEKTNGKLPIIGVGGIFTAEDAWDKITAGASLLQVYTGWIYEGPWMVRRILVGLEQRLQQHGCSSLADAVGLALQQPQNSA
ncbi:quinone-dependent dihydroorotate dehydrogenase [Leptolyngbya sp. AN02str]|uniref:quinone-dependent dihydroorotate dehydrogenase n=1 Tax=Leptolyngbya sp. AN02str TaxID=3423363 RepID=UPI003D31F191